MVGLGSPGGGGLWPTGGLFNMGRKISVFMFLSLTTLPGSKFT